VSDEKVAMFITLSSMGLRGSIPGPKHYAIPHEYLLNFIASTFKS